MIYDLVDMRDWKTKEQILKELKKDGLSLDERKFRKIVEQHNEIYMQHFTDKFIAHGPKGYKVTTDEKEIKMSAGDYMARAVDQFTKYHKIKKALGENANFNFQIKDGILILSEIKEGVK